MYVCRSLLLALVICTAPAYAQGYANQHSMVTSDNLPHTQFNQERLRIGIYDPSPIVTDWRHRIQPQPVLVSIPTMQESGSSAIVPTGAVQVGNGIYAIPSPGSGSTGNPMVGDLSHLPVAGFSSNVPQQPISAGRNLQDGSRTGIHSRMIGAPHAVAGINDPGRTFHSPARPLPFASPAIAKYPGENFSVGNASTVQTESILQGKLINKLLQKQR